MCEFTEILGLAWQASAGEPPEPVDVDEFKSRLFERIESVLVDSYIEDLTDWRQRLLDIGQGLALQAIARGDGLTHAEISGLSALNKFTMMQARRLEVVELLDRSEGRIRHHGDPPT